MRFQHDLTKGKSCLTSLVAFYDGLAASVDKERDVHVIHLAICTALDVVLFGTLISKLKTLELDG